MLANRGNALGRQTDLNHHRDIRKPRDRFFVVVFGTGLGLRVLLVWALATCL